MSNSDYKTTATGQAFAPVGQLSADVSAHDTIFTYYNLVTNSDLDVQVGMSMLIDDEIVGIDVITDTTFTVKRGCFDTIPVAHAEETLIWIIDGHIGVDLVPYMGTEQIGVKLLPRTSTAAMDIAYAPPLGIAMNQRMIRPYNVGQFKLNGGAWDFPVYLTAIAPDATLSWVERNRVIQADQLVGQLDASVIAEAGTTYVLHLFKIDGTQVATIDVTTSPYDYTRAQAAQNFNLHTISDTGDYPAYMLFASKRDGYESLQKYRVDFSVDTTGLAIFIVAEDGATELISEAGDKIVQE